MKSFSKILLTTKRRLTRQYFCAPPSNIHKYRERRLDLPKIWKNMIPSERY